MTMRAMFAMSWNLKAVSSCAAKAVRTLNLFSLMELLRWMRLTRPRVASNNFLSRAVRDFTSYMFRVDPLGVKRVDRGG